MRVHGIQVLAGGLQVACFAGNGRGDQADGFVCRECRQVLLQRFPRLFVLPGCKKAGHEHPAGTLVSRVKPQNLAARLHRSVVLGTLMRPGGLLVQEVRKLDVIQT
jgi:hypothetical protein